MKARDPTLVHRLFASLLGIWLAFLVNWPSGHGLSVWWALAIVIAGAVHICELQAAFDESQLRPRLTIQALNIVTIAFTAAGLGAVGGLLYGFATVDWSRVFLVALVVWGWIAAYELYKFLGPERLYYKE